MVDRVGDDLKASSRLTWLGRVGCGGGRGGG